jgi:hypothetical protein
MDKNKLVVRGGVSVVQVWWCSGVPEYWSNFFEIIEDKSKKMHNFIICIYI